MGRLQSLQVLRFLAALGVVESHTFGNQTGAIGVDVFFVISGFIITRTAMAHPQGFLANRATRVLPLYYVFGLPALAFAAVSGPLDWRTVLVSLTLWPGYDTFAIPALPVGWTLCFEAMFYVVVWLVLRGARPAWFLAAFAACDVLAGFTRLGVFDFLGSPLVLEFLFGVGLALAPLKSRALGAGALAIGVGAVGFCWVWGVNGLHSVIGGPGALARVLEWGAPSALIVFGALQFEGLARHALLAPAVFMGDASYSLYLSHGPIAAELQALHAPPLASLAAALVAAAAVHVWIERPLIRWVRQSRPLARTDRKPVGPASGCAGDPGAQGATPAPRAAEGG